MPRQTDKSISGTLTFRIGVLLKNDKFARLLNIESRFEP